MILVLYTTHLGANLEDDAVIRPIDLDDDAFLLSITLPSLQHALQEDACPCHLLWLSASIVTRDLKGTWRQGDPLGNH